MDFRNVDALTFDCYGTLIDWEQGILDVLEPWAQRYGLGVSNDELLASFGDFESEHEAATPRKLYPEILQAVFMDIARRYGVDPEPEEARAFARSVRAWPAFEDSAAALRCLKQHHKLAIISNIDRASFAHSQAKLGVEFDAVITAQDVGSYKPDRRNFEYAFERLKELGVERDGILHVAQSLFHDHEPAKALGLRTVWINRRAGRAGWGATRPPRGEVRPDLVVSDMAALVAVHRAG
ncbi:MAG: haloacid dehalogenase type II [Phycisphaerae bacterium]